MCVSCQNNFDHNLTIDFDKAKYNENSTLLKRILLNVNDGKCTYRVCNKCISSLLRPCLVKCTLCDKEVQIVQCMKIQYGCRECFDWFMYWTSEMDL